MKNLRMVVFSLIAAGALAKSNSNCYGQGAVIKSVNPPNPVLVLVHTNPAPAPVVATNQPAPPIPGAVGAPNETRMMPTTAKTNAAHFFIESGAYLLNPYKIDPTTRVLQPGDTDSAFYVQFNYANIWAFTPRRREKLLGKSCDCCKAKDHGVSSWVDLDGAFDLNLKAGFVFQDDDTPTASTVIGSGDFMAEATLGYNVWRDLRLGMETPALNDTWLAQSAGLEVSYGAVTDRAAFDVHHRIFAGPGYCAAIAMANGRESLIHFRLGAAGIESVSYVNATTREVEFDRGDPRFNLEWAFAFEAEAYIPLMKETFFTFGTRIYGGNDPNMWTAYLGITRPLDDIVSWLFP